MKLICALGRPAGRGGGGGELFAKSVEESTALVLGVDHQTIQKLEATCSSWIQGCINCGILVSGIRSRGVSSEHMENMEMFSCSPT